ncbi:hypothetical protein P2318_29940 [Myxococcaceae bacterium GXIMD 01537]
MALGLSLDPLRDSISEAVADSLTPQFFSLVISTGLVSWVLLAANPEPIFTKAAAIVSVLMLVYLGVETFLEVLDASRLLKWATDQATRPEELEQAAQRFARRVGSQVARVLVLAVMAVAHYGAAGGAALLASRVSMLPRYMDAVAVGATQLGLNLAHVGEVSAVTVVGSTVAISLPATAVVMGVRELGVGGGSGQLHHVISRRIARRLERHATLRGLYAERDPRFVMRATDKAAHTGYQRWHREVDDEVIAWLDRFPKATPEEFEAFLRQLYMRPEMRARFPGGF